MNNEVILAVDEITLKFVTGCVVDYEDKMIRAAFYVRKLLNKIKGLRKPKC